MLMKTETKADASRKNDFRWKLFAHEYLVDLNGSRAAIAAGYSENGAHVRASELLRNRKVQELIEKLTVERVKKVDLSDERVLRELCRLAFSDPRKFFNDDGTA